MRTCLQLAIVGLLLAGVTNVVSEDEYDEIIGLYDALTEETESIIPEIYTTTETASTSRYPGPELVGFIAKGTRVVRGKDWKWGDQDGGIGRKGTIVQENINGWVRVEWDSGETNSYRMGYDEQYDLSLADSETGFQYTTEIDITTESTIKSELSGPELASLMVQGTRVVRGKDWEWNDQDGGSGHEGTIIHENNDGWVRVEWDSGDMNSYRMGHNEKYDLNLADFPDIKLSYYTTAAPEGVTKQQNPIETTPESSTLDVAPLKIGTRVVRGKDWEWGDQDGGAGQKGTITREVIDGWVRVEWDSGESNSYRMGHDDKFDLFLTETSVSTTDSSLVTEVSSTMKTSQQPLSGPELAKLMTIGTRVVRGKDWKWDNQDGGIGCEGTVTWDLSDGWVFVEWDKKLGTYAYRMGHEDKYDLYLAEPDSTEVATTTISTNTLTGPEIAALLKVGTRVVRGKDWDWNDQDGGSGHKGTIVLKNIAGWVRVKWDSGEMNSYRMGYNGIYDLNLADAPDTQFQYTTETPEQVTEEQISKETPLESSKTDEANLKIGARVIRGKDWEWDDQDGGAGHKGTITREIIDGWVRVEWDSGESNSYRMGHDDKYDLLLAEDGDPIIDRTAVPEESFTIETTQQLLSEIELIKLMKHGTRVVRGKDWKWDNQDGGKGGKGTVTQGVVDGWVHVEWDAGNSDSYRMGYDDKFDLYLAETDSITTTTARTDVQTPPEIADLFKVDTRVVRGKDWDWEDQDGGDGQEGTVISGDDGDQWVKVRWDNGNEYSYRMGNNDKYDLKLAPTTKQCTPLSGSAFAAVVKVGDRVVRGEDWGWRDQDGGAGHEGEIIEIQSDGWVTVKWDSGDENSYRIGHNEKYDLQLACSATQTKIPKQCTPLSGSAFAAVVKVGDRVVRGEDWGWRDQDGGAGHEGEIIEIQSDGWVTVKWDSGDENSYRIGHNEKYDLQLACSATQTKIRKLTGPVIASLIKIGTRVVRGKDWIWTDQDGGAGSLGTVTGKNSNGLVTVEWDNGDIFRYRMGYYGIYDLDLADSGSTYFKLDTTTSPTTTTLTTTTTSTTTIENTPIEPDVASIKEANEEFGKLVEHELDSVPKISRIQTMQDILEVLKKYSIFH